MRAFRSELFLCHHPSEPDLTKPIKQRWWRRSCFKLDKKMKSRPLILISILLFLIPLSVFYFTEQKDTGDLGSLLGAFSGVIAVIWFYRGLRLQSLQIEEQRIQFTKQHHLQSQDSLLSFLEIASKKIEESQLEMINALGVDDPTKVSAKYFESIAFYKEAIESVDSQLVLEAAQSWLKIEEPCVKFMNSVKDVILLHKKRLGLSDIEDKNNDSAEFVYVHGSHFLSQPFISRYQPTAGLLSEQMMLISPGRASMKLSYYAALVFIMPKDIMKKDKIMADIRDHKSKDRPVPKICEKLLSAP